MEKRRKVVPFPEVLRPRTELNHAPAEIPTWLLQAIASRVRDLNTLLDAAEEWTSIALTHRRR